MISSEWNKIAIKEAEGGTDGGEWGENTRLLGGKIPESLFQVLLVLVGPEIWPLPSVPSYLFDPFPPSTRWEDGLIGWDAGAAGENK